MRWGAVIIDLIVGYLVAHFVLLFVILSAIPMEFSFSQDLGIGEPPEPWSTQSFFKMLYKNP